LSDVPCRMGWGEAYRLFELLANDPTSQVCAAMAGWQYPLTREGLILADHFDAFARVNFKKANPYPRPWDEKPKKFGNRSLTKEQLAAIFHRLRNRTGGDDG
jgi:hypothetical protein